MTELHTHEFDLPEMDPLFVEPHAVPCRHPRLWFALAAALPVSLVLWRIACTSLLLLQPWRLEFFTVSCASVFFLTKYRREWFWSDPYELPTRSMKASWIMICALGLGLHTGSIASTKKPPIASRTWNLANGVHVDVVRRDRSGLFSCAAAIRVRTGEGLSERAVTPFDCTNQTFSIPIRQSAADCNVSGNLVLSDSIGQELDETSIRFASTCHAVDIGW
jgi:hypothetical protein